MCEPGSRPMLTRCVVQTYFLTFGENVYIYIYIYILKWVLYVRDYLTFQNRWCALCGGACGPPRGGRQVDCYFLWDYHSFLPVWSSLNSGFWFQVCFPHFFFFVLDGCCESSQCNPHVYQKKLKRKKKKTGARALKMVVWSTSNRTL